MSLAKGCGLLILDLRQCRSVLSSPVSHCLMSALPWPPLRIMKWSRSAEHNWDCGPSGYYWKVSRWTSSLVAVVVSDQQPVWPYDVLSDRATSLVPGQPTATVVKPRATKQSGSNYSRAGTRSYTRLVLDARNHPVARWPFLVFLPTSALVQARLLPALNIPEEALSFPETADADQWGSSLGTKGF